MKRFAKLGMDKDPGYKNIIGFSITISQIIMLSKNIFIQNYIFSVCKRKQKM